MIKKHKTDLSVDFSAAPEVLQDKINNIFNELNCGGQTLVCALDNLDSIDDLSLDLFNSLIHTIQNKNVLFVGTYNNNNLTIEKSNIHDVLNLAKESASEITLSGFSKENVSKLVLSLLEKGEDVSSDLLDDIIKKTGGNPFYVTEIVTSLFETGLLKLEGNVWSAITDLKDYLPEAIGGAIKEKIARAKLDKIDRKVLSLAAVLDDIFKKETILALTSNLDKIDVVESLGHLEKSGLIRFFDKENRTYELAPQVRGFVYKEFISEDARQAYHEAVALTLDDFEKSGQITSYGCGPEEIEKAKAFHFSKSEPTNENTIKTIEHTLNILENWYVKKPRETIRFSKRALDMLRSSKLRGEKRFSAEMILLDKLQRALLRSMDFKEAEDVGKEALTRFSRENNNAKFRFNTNLGWIYEAQNDLELAKEYFESALKILDLTEIAEEQKVINRADCLSGLGRILWKQGKNTSAIKLFESALANGISGSDVKVDIYNNLAAVHQSMSNYAAALQNLKLANKVISYTENIDPYQQLRIFNTKGVIYGKILELKDCIVGLETLIDNEELDALVGEELDTGVGKIPRTETIEEKLHTLCILNYRRAAILANQTDNALASIYALTNMATANKYGGDKNDINDALRWLNTARIQLDRFENLTGRFYNLKGFVEIYTEQKKFDDAKKHLAECWAVAEKLDQPGIYATYYQTEAELFEKNGNLQRAQEAYTKSLKFYGDDSGYCMLIENRIKNLNKN